MGKILVITEKNSQAKALKRGLYSYDELKQKVYQSKYYKAKTPNLYYEGKKVVIIPATGHLVKYWDVADYLVADGKIPESKDGNYNWHDFRKMIPYIPNVFKYKPINDYGAAQLELLETYINSNEIDVIYNCGDPDAEGELLIREILQISNNKKEVKRMETKSLVPEDLARAFFYPKLSSGYTELYLEALARQQTDWLIGINYTTMFSIKTGHLFRIGRVMFPIIKFVYDREKEIENFKPITTYGIDLKIKHEKKTFKITSSKPEISFSKEQKNECESLCNELNNKYLVVTKVEKKKKSLNPKRLYSTNKLYQDMSNKYGIKTSKTAEICQKLYEDGRIMYPRTDCEYLQTGEIENTRKIIESLAAAGYPLFFHTKKSVFNDEKCGGKGEGGHTAIIITDKFYSDNEFSSLSPLEQAVYLAIFNRTVANFCEKPDVDETIVTFMCGDYKFKLSGSTINKKGFLEFEPRELEEELPLFGEGDVIENKFFKVVVRKTKAPSKVSEALLLQYLQNPFGDNYKDKTNEAEDMSDTEYALIKKGVTIGTADTMAAISQKTVQCGYLKLEKNTYYTTQKGRTLVEMFNRLGFHNLDPDRTIDMNRTIKEVGMGLKTIEKNKSEITTELYNVRSMLAHSNIVINPSDLKEQPVEVGKCPKCGSPVYDGKKAFYCGNEDCKFYMFKEDSYFVNVLGNKKITKTIAKSFLSDKRCAKVTGCKNKEGKKYDAYIKVDFSKDRPIFTYNGSVKKRKEKNNEQ